MNFFDRSAGMLRFFFLFAAVMMAGAAELEFEPGITDCRLLCHQPMKKMEYRSPGGTWQSVPPLKEPAETSQRRGKIAGLKAETEYEIRGITGKGRKISARFRTQAENPANVLTLIPTFENCSFELPDGEGRECKVEYRSAGSDQWRKALPPIWFPDERCWRGSLLELREDTEYEIRLRISGKKTVSGRFKTRNSDFPVAKTVVIRKLPFRITESGRPGAYVRYTADKPLKGSLMLEKVKHVILDGLTLDGDGCPAGIHLFQCEDVAVRNCDISNFCPPGKRGWDPAHFGRIYSLHNNRPQPRCCGIRVNESREVLIERCFIHNPAVCANSWCYSHPNGPEAIILDHGLDRVVIRHNDLAGADLMRWDDVINGSGNGHNDGGLGANGDVYGNYLCFSNDDACELEGGGRNLRFYRNRIEQTFAGISTGRCSFGPVYLFRNLLVNEGDQHGHFGPLLKNGMGTQGKGTVLFLYNTVANAHGPVGIFHSFHREKPVIVLPRFKGISRGNIFYSRSPAFPGNFFLWPGDYDRDVFGGGTAEKTVRDGLLQKGQERNAVWGGVRFSAPEKGDYMLTPGSAGWDFPKSDHLPEIRHAGACQEADIHALLGRKLNFTADAASLSTEGKELIFNIRAERDTPFRVAANDSFYTVDPMSGTLKAGEVRKFTVRAPAENTPLSRIYRGVFFIRQPDGFSLPLGIAFDRRKNPVSGMEIPDGGSVEIPRKDAYFIYLRGSARKGQHVLEVGQRKIKIQVSAYQRNGSEIIRLTDLSTGKLLRLELEAGKCRIRVIRDPKAELKVESIILTAEPDLIYNGCLQQEFK